MERRKLFLAALLSCSVMCMSAFAQEFPPDGEDGDGELPGETSVELTGVAGTVEYSYYKPYDSSANISYSAYSDTMAVMKYYNGSPGGQYFTGYDSVTISRGYMEFDLTDFLSMNIQIDAITKITISSQGILNQSDYPEGYNVYAMDEYEDGMFTGTFADFNAARTFMQFMPFSSVNPDSLALEIELTGDELSVVTDDIIAGKTMSGFMVLLSDETDEGVASGGTYYELNEGMQYGGHTAEAWEPWDPIMIIEYDENYVPPAAVPEPMSIVLLAGALAGLIRRLYKRS